MEPTDYEAQRAQMLKEHGFTTTHTILRKLQSSKALRQVPECILNLLVQFSSDYCYHCKTPRYSGTEKEQQLEWMRFHDGFVCGDCCREQCICSSCAELSDSAFGFHTYCEYCAFPLCRDCTSKCWCVWNGADVICSDCLD